MLDLCIEIEKELFKKCRDSSGELKEDGVKKYKTLVKSICTKMVD